MKSVIKIRLNFFGFFKIIDFEVNGSVTNVPKNITIPVPEEMAEQNYKLKNKQMIFTIESEEKLNFPMFGQVQVFNYDFKSFG